MSSTQYAWTMITELELLDLWTKKDGSIIPCSRYVELEITDFEAKRYSTKLGYVAIQIHALSALIAGMNWVTCGDRRL